jgi:hypothetical protein
VWLEVTAAISTVCSQDPTLTAAVVLFRQLWSNSDSDLSRSESSDGVT